MEQRIKLYLLLFFVICVTGLHAQTKLTVKAKTATTTTFTLSDIAKLTFSSGYMIVNKKDASNSSFLISDIRNLNFGIMTGTPQITDSESSKLSLYPIPAIDRLTIQFQSATSGVAQLQLIDLNGRVVLQQILDLQPGTNIHTFMVSRLTHGLYLCQLQHGTIIENTKFLKY